VQFVEFPAFTRAVPSILSEKEYLDLQMSLMERPDEGTLIPGGNGLRKIRVRSKRKGKSGGSRVIYYWYVSPERIDLCRIYEKSDKADLPKAEIKNILKELEK